MEKDKQMTGYLAKLLELKHNMTILLLGMDGETNSQKGLFFELTMAMK